MIRGFYRDILKTSGSILSDSGWRGNHIVETCDILVSALFKGQPDYRGICYLAIGTGETSWDTVDQEVSRDAVKLKKEHARYRLNEDSLRYIDRNGEFSDKPTDTVRVKYLIRVDGEKPVPLREFGLFGGSATDEPDSGLMIDYVIHPRISLSPEFTLERTIILRFSNTLKTVPEEKPLITGSSGKMLSLPLQTIDGIGKKYWTDLARSGITTLRKLAECDPLSYKGKIPLARFNEFRSKAAISLVIALDPEILEPFEKMSIKEFISTPVKKLAEGRLGKEDLELLRKQQSEVAMLESSFDSDKLRNLLVGELFPE